MAELSGMTDIALCLECLARMRLLLEVHDEMRRRGVKIADVDVMDLVCDSECGENRQRWSKLMNSRFYREVEISRK